MSPFLSDSTGQVIFDYIFEGGKGAVVHVGRCARNLAQRDEVVFIGVVKAIYRPSKQCPPPWTT